MVRSEGRRRHSVAAAWLDYTFLLSYFAYIPVYGRSTGLLTIVDDAISGEVVIALSGTGSTPAGLSFLAPVALLLTRLRRVSYHMRTSVLLFACLALIALTGCGGGGSISTPPQTLTTPPGTYTLTLTTTTGTATTSQLLTLTVK